MIAVRREYDDSLGGRNDDTSL